ncbi:MAG: DUF1501 domain-containing protein, partial [Burkholderiales bacterium]|nr:DUF1501 domain-containing protein [Burkholderiales bacterium]
TKTDYQANRNLPPRLFSHNDQQDEWMSSEPDALKRQGWGGKLAERLASMNMNPQLSMNISIAGNNRFQTADAAIPYVLSSSGVQRLTAFSGTSQTTMNRKAAYDQLLSQAQSGHLFEAHSSQLTSRSLALADQVDAALVSGPTLTTVFPTGNRLADQLRMVARLISVRDTLQLRRQVFFVSLGGFDTHDDQLTDQAALLTQVAQGMKAFYDATVELGVADSVTTFSMTDFGRTLTTNGDGSDHAWGNVNWVLGGSVVGHAVYGNYPDLTINGVNDAGGGRLIPTTSVDQYGATLARWLGASDGDLGVIFPHLARFATANLGFMA